MSLIYPMMTVRRKSPKEQELSMLTRSIFAQWPAGELRDSLDFFTVTMPNGETGRNRINPIVYTQAVEQGYAKYVEVNHRLRYERTDKRCKQPNTAEKRNGRFPVSQEVHQCLVWGHPVWQHLEWASRMNPTARDVITLATTLRPYLWLGQRFGQLRWALGKYLMHGMLMPRSITMLYGSDLRITCGMLRIGLQPTGALALLTQEEGLKLVLEALSRNDLFERITVTA